jgi:hypothetical protein
MILQSTLCALMLCAPLAPDQDAYMSASRKLAALRAGVAEPGSRTWLSLNELNAYGVAEVLAAVPKGVRDARLELGHSTATAYAIVDLMTVLELRLPTVNPLLAWLLSGERPLTVKARIQSGKGKATVFLDDVRLSGVTARGAVLDFLLENLFIPFHPAAAIGRPFALKHRVERLEINPQGVTVVVAR